MKINKKGNFFDFDQMVSLFYDGGKYTARKNNGTEVVGYIANCVAETKYYWNDNMICIRFLGYFNQEEMRKKLVSFSKSFSHDNNLVVKTQIMTTEATICWS